MTVPIPESITFKMKAWNNPPPREICAHDLKLYFEKCILDVNPASFDNYEKPIWIGNYDCMLVKSVIEEMDRYARQLTLCANGDVYLRGAPGRAHSAICGVLMRSLFEASAFDEDNITVGTDPHVEIGDVFMCPDVYLSDYMATLRISDSHNNSFPTFIGEVSVNQGLNELMQKLSIWMCADSDVCSSLAIKIFKQSRNGMTTRMVLIYWHREEEPIGVDFGTDIVDPPNTFEFPTCHIILSRPVTGSVSVNLASIREKVAKFI